ncbi:CAP domain-containing protein [Aquabacterium sp. OR-4]|uniref:CAP domain-containing protein n=1 Tax=Aquabacterium sp. OR-4 TaxID=2978127 RepID=UPI0021B3AB5B|nr:CAP domain-containing protein [Aquabacterium sp. OR-4]MDT7834347.1 CAP domain-containing protein [Aquabacterium sp. OR-4]
MPPRVDRAMALALVLGLALALTSAAAVRAAEAASPCPPVDLPQQALQSVNALRAQGARCAGRWMPAAPALQWSGAAAMAAAGHAADMAGQGGMAHRGSDGSQGGDRLERAGYVWSSWGENLGQGHRSVPALVAHWAVSAGHCANLLNPRFTELGMACARSAGGEPYWAMTLARPSAVPGAPAGATPASR